MNKKSFEKYPTAKVGFYDNNIAFAAPDLSSQVSAMKKAGVDFVTTCLDTKESLVLAKEMARQGLAASAIGAGLTVGAGLAGVLYTALAVAGYDVMALVSALGLALMLVAWRLDRRSR